MNDNCKKIQGHVKAYLVGKGEKRLVADIHNTILGNTACSLADLYAGGRRFIPTKMAFIYGSSALTLSGNFPTYEDITDSVSSSNLHVVPFSFRPSTDKADDDYDNDNVAVFHAHTVSGPSGTIQNVVLLGGDGADPVPLSIATLGVSKPTNMELAVDWSITFNEGISNE